jgi:hypothetical protein
VTVLVVVDVAAAGATGVDATGAAAAGDDAVGIGMAGDAAFDALAAAFPGAGVAGNEER